MTRWRSGAALGLEDEVAVLVVVAHHHDLLGIGGDVAADDRPGLELGLVGDDRVARGDGVLLEPARVELDGSGERRGRVGRC